MKKLMYLALPFIVVSCHKENQTELGGVPHSIVPVTIEMSDTKTAIADNNIRFVGGESMTLICEDVNVARLTNEGIDANKFKGSFASVGKTSADAVFYAVYPYVGTAQMRDVRCNVPMTQFAPFDGNANYMCSDMVVADYDENGSIALSMNMRQLLGILKISFKNTSEAYKNELINEVELTASTALTGSFLIEFDESGKPYADFLGTKGRVLSAYRTPVQLGVNKVHEVYMFVNPTEISGAEITIRTDKHVFKRTASAPFAVPAGDVTFMDPMDVAQTFQVSEFNVKRLVLWGDSYTNRSQAYYTHVDRSNYAYHLGQMLGTSWKIYNGGSSGDQSHVIATRQGGIQMCTGAQFTIPSTCTPVVTDGLYSYKDMSFTDGKYTKIARFSMINPIEIVVEDASGNEIARVEGTTDDGKSFTRTSPGESIVVPAHSKVVTYAAKNLRNPDLTIIYMGQNGGFSNLDVLYKQYRAMIDFAYPEGPEHYIVLGFHNHTTLAKWNGSNAYWDFFGGSAGFGMNEAQGRPISRFVNLFTELAGENFKEYLVLSGAAPSIADVSAEDIKYVEAGMIPASYWYSPPREDIHPNEYGAKAFATLVYDKMVELGYVE